MAPEKGYKHSELTKKKISEAGKGRVAHNKGVPATEEHKRKISEAMKGRRHSTESKLKMSEAQKGRKASEETREKMSKSRLGKHHTNKTKDKMRKSHSGQIPWNKGISPSEESNQKNRESNLGKKHSEESKRKVSATKQGISYDEWGSFVSEKKYCPKFDEVCRESNRAKYNHECFICGLPQSQNLTKNGKVRKLSVHHVDMDKAQGCESNWKLVPLCMKHHAIGHTDELVARLGYLFTGVQR